MKKAFYFGGAAVLGALLLFYLLRKPSEPAQGELIRRDSVTIAKHDQKRIEAMLAAQSARIKADSVAHVQERKAHENRVATLERKIRAINRQHATPDALDSIRRVLYPDGTEIDSTYAMPLKDARACLQAAEQAPLKDFLILELKGRVVDLDGDVFDLQQTLDSRDSLHEAQHQADQVVIRNTEAMLSNCDKKRKGFWPRAWGAVKDVFKVAGGAGLGYMAGRAVH